LYSGLNRLLDMVHLLIVDYPLLMRCPSSRGRTMMIAAQKKVLLDAYFKRVFFWPALIYIEIMASITTEPIAFNPRSVKEPKRPGTLN